MDWMEIGEKIKEARISEGLLFSDLAKELSVSEELLENLEEGLFSEVSLPTFLTLAKRLGLSVSLEEVSHKPRAGKKI